MLLVLALILILSGAQGQGPTVIPIDDPDNITIAYGSCLNTFAKDSYITQALQSIIRTQPDLWMWIGDAIYLDGGAPLLGSLPGPGYDIDDANYVQNTFNTLKNNPNYVQLRDNMPIIGTWDDHDYAYDNADKTFKYKDRNKGFYLDFLDEPADSPRRDQPGVYTSYYIGEEKLIKVILLDVRYNRDDASTLSNLLDTDTTSRFDDILGEEQWQWLDAELQDPDGTYTLIVSGTQYLPDDRPLLPNWFEDSKDRFLDLIRSHQKSGVVLLSGDVHYAEMIRYPCPSRVGYKNLYEFTSSGLTHSASDFDAFDGVLPNTYNTEADRYLGKNFALFKLVRTEGSTDPPNLYFEARDSEGNVVLTRTIVYEDLVYDQAVADSYDGCDVNVWDRVSNTADNIADNVKDTFNDIGDEVKDTANDLADNVKDTFNDVGDKLSDAADDVKDTFSDIGDAIGDLFSKEK